MVEVLSPPSSSELDVVSDTEQRFVMQHASWATYQTLRKTFEDQPIRLTFDRGRLELMSPSGPHERIKKLLDRLLIGAAEELEIEVRSQGSTTFGREDLDRGLEPDECYYIEHEADVRDHDEPDTSCDPPPDLAIEIEVSRSALNRMGIYAALGVPEVWRVRGTEIHVFHLDDNGQYQQVLASLIFPQLSLSYLTELLDQRFETTELKLVRKLRRWIQEHSEQIGETE